MPALQTRQVFGLATLLESDPIGAVFSRRHWRGVGVQLAGQGRVPRSLPSAVSRATNARSPKAGVLYGPFLNSIREEIHDERFDDRPLLVW